ncbi:MAG: NAD(P)-binding domain-containing protein [Ignavibacteriaceae bacterium]
MKVYYDDDASFSHLENKKIAVLGFGSQGHAHSLSLKDSGMNVVVGLRKDSKRWDLAVKAGIEVKTVPDAVKWADVIMILLPDQVQKEVYDKDIAPYVEAGNTLAFGHGFNIHYKQIIPPEDVNIMMIAPQSPGHLVISHLRGQKELAEQKLASSKRILKMKLKPIFLVSKLFFAAVQQN